MKRIIKVVLAVIAIVGVGLVFFFYSGRDDKTGDVIHHDISREQVSEEENAGGIYEPVSDGKESSQAKIRSLQGDRKLGQNDAVFDPAWMFVKAYEAEDVPALKGMLTTGVHFDYERYFKELKKNITNPLVRIQGFYRYETETACVCEVTGRVVADNGEEVYDLENKFNMTFAVLADGSVMPYSEEAGMLGDPYLEYGLSAGKNGKN